MLFDFSTIPASHAYKLLVSAVVPRPIAWVVTQNADGVVNAAPFSFFNAFCPDPPIVCLGIGSRRPGVRKDTTTNIDLTGEFVVNLVSEALAPKMNVTAVNFEYGVDELERAGLTKAASHRVKPPRIAESPVALECVKVGIHEIGPQHSLVIGRVVAMYVLDEAVIDRERYQVDTPKLHLIGRVHGAGMYVRLSDLFEMRRLPDFT